MLHRFFILLSTVALAGGCSDSSPLGNGNGDGGGDGGNIARPDLVTAAPDLTSSTSDLVAARPYHFKVPKNYDASKPTPLVVLLHGYTASGPQQELYFQLGPVADAHTFLYAYPDGTLDAMNNRFWNATDACCNFYGSTVDDVAYLNAVIDDVEKKYNVDTKRVYFVGHSNGAFMSHRMACDSSSRIAAIVALAGDNWLDPTHCKASEPVAALQVHGDADMTIRYGGGHPGDIQTLPAYPPARDSISTWAKINGCSSAATKMLAPLDLDSGLPGPETQPEQWQGCKAGVELWTIHGGGHIPAFQPSWGETVWGFLSAHPKG